MSCSLEDLLGAMDDRDRGQIGSGKSVLAVWHDENDEINSGNIFWHPSHPKFVVKTLKSNIFSDIFFLKLKHRHVRDVTCTVAVSLEELTEKLEIKEEDEEDDEEETEEAAAAIRMMTELESLQWQWE